ncbi:autotransporter outer membrane beta-barrel domain-containing protein [uncultured Algimonas sp.]|uniref:autotransporter family protein n=1 Tax=uncultured Algimonas sp. TaxID=1547920 RepID=UPI0026365175|nr:autotransporter outer membrane beta-barrel domain-containing protein [uncultured Algimonas sp.]
MVRHTRPISIRPFLLCSAALLAATPAFAQVEIADDRTAPVRTSTAGDGGAPADVTITSDGSVVLTTAGPAVTLDSANDLTNAGQIRITDVDNATGVSLEGGADRNFTNSGTIRIDENFDDANTDADPFADTPFASGTGRTGILVSGASPFQGNITLAETSNIIIEGNNSAGVDLSNTPLGAGLDGNLALNGRTSVRGNNSTGVRVGSAITGNLTSDGLVEVVGAGSGAFDIGADIGGGFASTGSVTSNGFRFGTRPAFNPNAAADRTDLGAEDLGQAASAIAVRANIARGINLTERTTTANDAQGNPVTTVASRSAVTQSGSAPAILIDGDGTPLMIGTVSAITDPAAAGYDADELFAFINLGTVRANGIYNDFDATAVSISDATLDGGIRNARTIQAETFVGSVRRPIDGVDLGTGLARVLVLGDNAIVERLNNSGLIIAQVSEATDEVYFDSDNVPAPRPVVATAIDIGANASLPSIENDGTLSAILIGRNGTATVVNDASGSLSNIVNRGSIAAVGRNSDATGAQETDFTLVALDLSANTSGVTFLQEQRPDPDTTDTATPNPPALRGDIRFGSGNDTLTSTAGTIAGNVDFGAGDDRLALTNTEFSGAIANQGGLAIEAVNSTVTVLSEGPVGITSASFDSGSTFRPLVDGASGQAATLQATGAISFANGAQITPVLRNAVNTGVVGGEAASFALASASDLTIGDLGALNAVDDGSFLFDTNYSVTGETLFITLDLRNAEQLGLDRTQTGLDQSAYGATLQALQTNTALGNEIANLATADEFYSAYNQLLPEFAAAARQFVIANSDGAIGAVGNHLDAARRSPDKPGGAWIQQFAYFADRDKAGLSEQYRGEGFGFTGGLDTAWGPFHAVGVNLGFASTEIEDVVGVDEPLDVTSVLAGIYAGYMSGKLGIDAYLGGGFNDFEQNRRVRIGDFSGRSSGDWNGTHLSGSLRAGYDMDFGKRYWARPVVSLDYVRLSEDGYQETGDVGVALSVEDRTSEMGAVSGILNFGAEFTGERTWIRPSIRIGYRNEFLSDPVLTSYSFSGITNAAMARTQSADFPTSGMLLGFSVAAGSGFSSVAFDFDSDIRDGFIRHTGRVVVRLLF